MTPSRCHYDAMTFKATYSSITLWQAGYNKGLAVGNKAYASLERRIEELIVDSLLIKPPSSGPVSNLTPEHVKRLASAIKRALSSRGVA